MLGPPIFWTNIVLVIMILVSATLSGRFWSHFFSDKLKSIAGFFLAPSLGIATWVILASVLGRWIPFSNSVAIPFLFFLLIIVALIKEPNIRQAFAHSLVVSGYGLICGLTVLAPLFFWGGFNAHNDAFTYLAHSDWLQNHAFNQWIPPEEVTPASTQIATYQQLGFRMGASFLLAFFQSLFNLKWSYTLYPAVNICGMAACFLSMGFPLARWLSRFSRCFQLMVLSLPAFSMGGMIFAANYGFLPQVIGLSMGAALIFAMGPILKQLTEVKTSRWQSAQQAIPLVLLFVSSTYAYSELTPFLCLTGFIILLFLFFCTQYKKQLILFLCCFVLLSLLLLNTEIFRVLNALSFQAGTVVGAAVDWTLVGFLAHALGLHGGAWDVFQWSDGLYFIKRFIVLGFGLLGLSLMLLIFSFKKFKKKIFRETFMTSVIMLLLLISGMLYYRYVVPVPSVFLKGVGQSWSQFKLMDWAHPFATLLLLFAIMGMRLYLGKFFKIVILSLFLVLGITSIKLSKIRMNPLKHYYAGVSNISQYYQDVRHAVLKTCSGKSLYLELGGYDYKFRQMVALFLFDQPIVSNWMDDGYIAPQLSKKNAIQALKLGDCLLESVWQSNRLKNSIMLGPARLGHLNQGGIKLMSSIGGYGRESDGKNWWQWVERQITFQLQPFLLKSNIFKKTQIYLEYLPLGNRPLTLILKDKSGNIYSKRLPFHSEKKLSTYEVTVEALPDALTTISVKSQNEPVQLSQRDFRKGSFMIRNLQVIPHE